MCEHASRAQAIATADASAETWRLEGLAALEASVDIEMRAERLPRASLFRRRMLEQAADWRLFAGMHGAG